MTHRDVAAEPGDDLLIEHLGDKPEAFVRGGCYAVADTDASRLLPPVLELEQSIEADAPDLGSGRAHTPTTPHASRGDSVSQASSMPLTASTRGMGRG